MPRLDNGELDVIARPRLAEEHWILGLEGHRHRRPAKRPDRFMGDGYHTSRRIYRLDDACRLTSGVPTAIFVLAALLSTLFISDFCIGSFWAEAGIAGIATQRNRIAMRVIASPR